jgi:hypothetical protein
LPALHCCLNGLRRTLLVVAHEAQAVLVDEGIALSLVFPTCFLIVGRHLGAGDVVGSHHLVHQPGRVRLKLGVARNG